MNEAAIQSSLNIRIGSLLYRSQPISFQANVSVANGPTPGTITATLDGTVVNLSQLATPGLCRVMNLDATNTITLGAWDPIADKFYPIFDYLPGESFVNRLSAELGLEYGPGTGTIGHGKLLMVRSSIGPCNALVEVFNI